MQRTGRRYTLFAIASVMCLFAVMFIFRDPQTSTDSPITINHRPPEVRDRFPSEQSGDPPRNTHVGVSPQQLEDPIVDPRISALLDTDDPLERRYFLAEILKEVHSREDFERLGLTAGMLDCEDPERSSIRLEPGRVYDILSLLANTSEAWAQEYVEDLARSGEVAAVARAVLLADVGQPWAQQALERVYAELRTQEGMPWQFLDSAVQAGSLWGDEFYLREYQSAPPETRAEWARQNMLSEYRHLSAADDVRQVAFLMALRDPEPTVREEAVAFLLDESHMVHPNGVSWSTGLLMEAFNEGGPAGQVAMLEATRNVLLSRLDNENSSGQLGNTTAIDALLRQALASPDIEVLDAAQNALDTMASAVDVESASAELASFALQLRELTRQLR